MKLGFKLTAPGACRGCRCATLELLEATQVNKLDFVHSTFTNAVAIKRGADGTGPTRPQQMNAMIRERLAMYFAGEIDLGCKPTIVPLTPTLTREIRSDTRSLLANIPLLEWPSTRAIARIFHGIASPRYPSRMWYTHRAWKHYELVDFNRLREAVAAERRAAQLR